MNQVFQPEQSRYELEEKLGEGLSAVVWRATRAAPDGHRARVALKILKDSDTVSFLRREYETLHRVRSPFCARVIAWECCNGEPALALEWIDGVTLFDFARAAFAELAPPPTPPSTPTPATWVANFAGAWFRDRNRNGAHSRASARNRDSVVSEIIRQIHLGLCDLRDAGLFHGDLHPKNVMIDRAGRIRLIDFASGRTAEGLIQATPAFLAPEVWTEGTLSFAADLFALGVIREHLPNGFAHTGARAASERNGLRAKDPAKRTLETTKFPENRIREAQAQIAFEVAKLLAAKDQGFGTQLIEPAPLSAERHVKPKWRLVVAVAAFVITTGLSVFAQNPLDTELPAILKISSMHWMKISVDGGPFVYTPAKVALKHGEHRVTFKSATSSGELQENLMAGEIRRFAESPVTGRLEEH